MEKHESSETVIINSLHWGLPLPPHMASLIFSKLSIFSLPDCRCVSKSWNRLVLDYAASCPKLHFPNIAIMITNYNRERNPKIHCFDLDTFTFVATNRLVGTDLRHSRCFNCCNGILLINEHIYNPMTHEFFPVPRLLLSKFQNPVAEGFGFSLMTKQYKIFRLAIKKPTCELKVLRFGSNHNQWTSIHLSSPIHICSHGVYMNGFIYWMGKQNRDDCVIYAFDVESENFEVVGTFKTTPHHIFNPRPFNGTIYVIVSVKKPISQIELWRMHDKNSWTRDFIVPTNFSNDWNARTVHLLKASKDGQILVQIKRKLFWLKSGKMIGNKETTTILFSRKIMDYSVFPMESLHFGSPLHFGSLPSILAGDA